MLRSLRELKGYRVSAVDGELGRVRDMLFDDERWTVRYLVAATGPWLFGRKVLVGWPALDRPDWEAKRFRVQLTTRQVKESPSIDRDAPVSRLFERELHRFSALRPFMPADPVVEQSSSDPGGSIESVAHLRSVDEVVGYGVETRDGALGHVEDFLADDRLWVVRSMVVGTRSWLPGRKVLVDPAWVEGFHWRDQRAAVGLSTRQLEQSPGLARRAPLDRDRDREM